MPDLGKCGITCKTKKGKTVSLGMGRWSSSIQMRRGILRVCQEGSLKIDGWSKEASQELKFKQVTPVKLETSSLRELDIQGGFKQRVRIRA